AGVRPAPREPSPCAPGHALSGAGDSRAAAPPCSPLLRPPRQSGLWDRRFLGKPRGDTAVGGTEVILRREPTSGRAPRQSTAAADGAGCLVGPARRRPSGLRGRRAAPRRRLACPGTR